MTRWIYCTRSMVRRSRLAPTWARGSLFRIWKKTETCGDFWCWGSFLSFFFGVFWNIMFWTNKKMVEAKTTLGFAVVSIFCFFFYQKETYVDVQPGFFDVGVEIITGFYHTGGWEFLFSPNSGIANDKKWVIFWISFRFFLRFARFFATKTNNALNWVIFGWSFDISLIFYLRL